MNILYISHLHPPKEAILKNIGGMQRVSMQLTAQLESDPDVHLTEITQETGWKFIGLKTTWFLIKLVFMLPKIIRKYNADVVLFSSMVTASVSPFTRKRISKPMVCITHGHDVTLTVGIYQWYVPKMFRALDAVISVSSATQQECINRGLDPEKSKVLPNGFSIKGIELIPNKINALKELEKHLGFTLGNRKLLLTVGRMIKRKGHEWFINEVLPKVKSDVMYLIIGDGAEFQKINKAVENSPLKNVIYLTGRQPDQILEDAYVAADLFIMPNIKVVGDMEGFGVVLLEANIRLTPAIASDLEGIRDVITNGKNGFRIEVGNSTAFAGKIDEVLHGAINELSISSRTFVEQQFSWDHVGRDYIHFLRKIADK